MRNKVRTTERLYLTADRSRLVTRDSPEARWLWAPAGAEVDPAELERLGYKKSGAEGDKSKPAPQNKSKRGPRGGNK